MDEKKRHFLQGKSIIIAGGGIAGLSFTASLLQLWDPNVTPPPSITIIERDSDDAAKQREGYSLSLAGYDDTGGLVALKKMALLEDTLASAVSGTEGVAGSFKIWGPDWRERISFRRRPVEGVPSASVRIARRELRRILQGAISDRVTILWETQCVAARGLHDGRVRVELRTQHTATVREQDCDLLIIADGASSKLRAHLRPHDQLEYTGAVLRGGLSRFSDALPAPIRRDWGFVLSGDGVSCFVSPVDDKSLVWAVGHLERDQVPTMNRDSVDDAKAVISRARQLGARFQEPFQTIVDHTDLSTTLCLNARDKMPFQHDEMLPTLAAVFIGDSNHALSPFAGYGANLALRDGWDLAEQLTARTSLAEAIAAYDAVSVPRAVKLVKGSRARVKMGHATGWRLWLFCVMLAVGRFMSWVWTPWRRA